MVTWHIFSPNTFFLIRLKMKTINTSDVYVNVTDYSLYAKKGFGKAIVGCCRKG